MTFPEPYRTRPARRDDLGALVELFEARDLADVGFLDQAREEIIGDWSAPFIDLERDSIVAEAPGGAIAAYGIVQVIDPNVQIAAVGKVHPAHTGRGLGSAILDEQERSATARLGVGVTSPFRTSAPSTDEAASRLFSGAGYQLVRSSWLMQRPLPADDLERAEPEGITFRAGSSDDEPLMHTVTEESFQEHFGYEPVSYEDWQVWVRGAPGYDPGLAVLAFAGQRPAGVAVNFAADDGAGWVGDLGVLAAFRGRGVGRGLLARSFAVLAGRGHHEVRLGVDTENATGATHLYQRVGMTVRRRFDVYEKSLTGA